MPTIPPITTPDPNAALREWFALLGHYCANVDYDATHAIFATDVASFGTKASIVIGIEALRKNQWQNIWPNIADFRIDLDSVHGGGNENLAWGMAVWTSTGFDREGTPFDRPGRATVVLEYRDGAWLAVHTHFSLAPGTAPFTYATAPDC